jgi:hypothetical protein
VDAEGLHVRPRRDELDLVRRAVAQMPARPPAAPELEERDGEVQGATPILPSVLRCGEAFDGDDVLVDEEATRRAEDGVPVDVARHARAMYGLLVRREDLQSARRVRAVDGDLPGVDDAELGRFDR